MVQQMSQTPQPSLLSAWVAAFGRFDAAHGWAVNLFVVVALAGTGAVFLRARRRVVQAGVAAGAVLCLADWVLVQDFGFLGGLGTDPNSMVPMALVFVAGLPRAHPGTGRRLGTTVVPIGAPARGGTWWGRLTADPVMPFVPPRLSGHWGDALGVVPMAAAATVGRADPVLAHAVDGAPQAVDATAAPFRLVDQPAGP